MSPIVTACARTKRARLLTNLLLLAVAAASITFAVAPASANDDPRCATRPNHPMCLEDHTSSPPPPPAPDPGPDTAGSVAAIGCSNTSQHIDGYLAASDLDYLAGPQNLGGGTLLTWSSGTSDTSSSFWASYETHRPADGYTSAWIQVCLRADEHEGTLTASHEAAITSVVNEIRARDGDIQVSVSALNAYAEGHVCSATGTTGVAVTAAVADWAVANLTNVMRGPDTGPLGQDLLDADGCHLNDSGVTFVGDQLVFSFDLGPADPPISTLPPLTPGSVAVVGCSNTSQHIDGYLAASELDALAGPQNLSGGSLGRWEDAIANSSSRYWSTYEAMRPTDGYLAVWVQVCLRSSEHSGVFTQAEELSISALVAELRTRDGDVPILVSPLNSYEDGLVCDATGADGVAVAAAIADWAAANIDGVDRGPDTGPVGTDQLLADGCHLNDAGIALVGDQLLTTFDG